MNFIKRIFGKKEPNGRLLGDWFSDLNDPKARNETGDIKMTFTKDGKLIYQISEANKKQIINMIYLIEGDA